MAQKRVKTMQSCASNVFEVLFYLVTINQETQNEYYQQLNVMSYQYIFWEAELNYGENQYSSL